MYKGHLFIQNFQNLIEILKSAGNSEKVFVSEKIESQLAALICRYEKQDTFHRQPMC